MHEALTNLADSVAGIVSSAWTLNPINLAHYITDTVGDSITVLGHLGDIIK